MPAVSIRRSRRAPGQDCPTEAPLPHWSEVSAGRSHSRPSPRVAGVLRDLVAWACDFAQRLSPPFPEDRDAIERVRAYALAWIAGHSPGPISLDDVLMTTATLMSGIDRRIGGTVPPDDERNAVGA